MIDWKERAPKSHSQELKGEAIEKPEGKFRSLKRVKRP